MTVGFEMINQGGRVLDLGALQHEFLIQGQPLLSGKFEPGPIKANGKKTQRLTTKLSFLGAASSLYSLITSKKPVTVRLKGTTDVDTGYGIIPMDFDTSEGLKVLGL